MRWWARLRLRTKIFLVFAPLLLAALILTLGLTQLVVSRQVNETLRHQLSVTGRVFGRLVAERGDRLLAQTTLLGGDFALKRAIATYDPSTLASVADNYRERLSVDLFWITDEKGALLADASGSETVGASMARQAPLADSLVSGKAAAAITEVRGTLHQLVTIPVLAPEPIGYLAVGTAIDAPTAEQLQKETGSRVSFLAARRVLASSWPRENWEALGVNAERELGRGKRLAPFLMTLDGERWLSELVVIGADLPEPLHALVQRSYDEALEPLAALRRRIVAIGLGALLAALAIGGGFANAITAPIRLIVQGMRDVRQGNLRRRLSLQREDEIGYMASSFDEMVEGLEERERIKETFGRFVSKDVADVVLSGRIPLDGERRDVTILFQDIRGFTALSENTDPVDLLRILNQFLTEMVAAVEAEGGVVHKFTGDGVMVLFGAPVAHADDPERAVRAALGMVRRLDDLNRKWAEDGAGPQLRIGIGVHTGEVVAGQIGPDDRIEYSVIGDPVNLASRIEGLTKEVGVTVLISSVTAERLGADFLLGRRSVVSVRGKEAPVEVVEVLGHVAEPGPVLASSSRAR